MDYDKNIIYRAGYFSRDEHIHINKMFKKLLDLKDPQAVVLLAMFRDIHFFKQSSQAYILRLESRIAELELRLEK